MTTKATAAAILKWNADPAPVPADLLAAAIEGDAYRGTLADRVAATTPLYIVKTTFPGLILEGEGVGFENAGGIGVDLETGMVVMAAYDAGDGPTFGPLLVVSPSVHDEQGNPLTVNFQTPTGRIIDGGAAILVGHVITHHRADRAMTMGPDGVRFLRTENGRRVCFASSVEDCE